MMQLTLHQIVVSVTGLKHTKLLANFGPVIMQVDVEPLTLKFGGKSI